VPPPLKHADGTVGNIILVEEYAALAVAFSSVLRRFAPECQTHVVPSLAEAEGLIREFTPELLVIDFDPAHAGAVSFFNRIANRIPSARVVIISGEETRGIKDDPDGPAAFEFITKPFDLQNFGAIVQGLLQLGEGGKRGRLADLNLCDMIVLHVVIGGTNVLKVRSAAGRSGEVHFASGRISHAVTTQIAGREALQEMLRWEALRFAPGENQQNAPRSIHGGWQSVLLGALRASRKQETAALPAPLPPKPAIPVPAQ